MCEASRWQSDLLDRTRASTKISRLVTVALLPAKCHLLKRRRLAFVDTVRRVFLLLAFTWPSSSAWASFNRRPLKSSNVSRFARFSNFDSLCLVWNFVSIRFDFTSRPCANALVFKPPVNCFAVLQTPRLRLLHIDTVIVVNVALNATLNANRMCGNAAWNKMTRSTSSAAYCSYILVSIILLSIHGTSWCRNLFRSAISFIFLRLFLKKQVSSIYLTFLCFLRNVNLHSSILEPNLHLNTSQNAFPPFRFTFLMIINNIMTCANENTNTLFNASSVLPDKKQFTLPDLLF